MGWRGTDNREHDEEDRLRQLRLAVWRGSKSRWLWNTLAEWRGNLFLVVIAAGVGLFILLR